MSAALSGIRFDYANLLCNPDLPASTIPARLLRQSRVIAQAAGLERQRLLQWTLAFAGLSAAWKTAMPRAPRTTSASPTSPSGP
jgi:streptomycin 6-kinase